MVASSFTADNAALTSLGVEMLMDPTLLNIEARPEYAHLARSVIPVLPADTATDVSNFLLAGEWIEQDQLERLKGYLGPWHMISMGIGCKSRRIHHRII